MVLTLIGYRGSGKSTVARPLAQRLGWAWVDADTVIEASAGKTIKQIFELHGEATFREYERRTMSDLFTRADLVIAAGGGAILNADTRRLMRAAGPVVWLQASLETLNARIQEDATTAARRPNLTSQGGLQEISKVLAVREPLYRECASLIVDTEGAPVSQIVDQIVDHIHSV